MQTVRAIGHPHDQLAPLTAIVAAQVQAGQTEAALQIACAIEEPAYRAAILAAVTTAQAKAGQGEQARLTFAHALQSANAIDFHSERCDALHPIAAAQAAAGQVEAALQTVRAIDYGEDQSQALRAVATEQARAGQTEAALQTARAIEDAYHQAWALQAVAAAQAQAGEAEAARLTFEQALQTAHVATSGDEDASYQTFLAMAAAQRERDRWRLPAPPLTPSSIRTTGPRSCGKSQRPASTRADSMWRENSSPRPWKRQERWEANNNAPRRLRKLLAFRSKPTCRIKPSPPLA